MQTTAIRKFIYFLYLFTIISWMPALVFHIVARAYTFRGFLPSPEYQTIRIFIAGAYLSAWLAFYASLKPGPYALKGSKSSHKMALIGGALLLSWAAAYVGLPSTFYWLTTGKKTISTSISGINLSFGSKFSCSTELYVTYSSGILSDICVSRSTGESLRKGDPVKISGWWHPWFGLYAEKIEKSGLGSTD